MSHRELDSICTITSHGGLRQWCTALCVWLDTSNWQQSQPDQAIDAVLLNLVVMADRGAPCCFVMQNGWRRRDICWNWCFCWHGAFSWRSRTVHQYKCRAASQCNHPSVLCSGWEASVNKHTGKIHKDCCIVALFVSVLGICRLAFLHQACAVWDDTWLCSRTSRIVCAMTSMLMYNLAAGISGPRLCQ